MKAPNFARAGIMALIVVVISILCWESYLRHKGVTADYDDGGPLWSDKRARVYEASDQATVFVGDSRIKFDVDIPTWESITGEDAIQLGMVGSSPRPVLENLANDPNFKGKVIIDVTEPIFFSSSPFFFEDPNENISFYKKETPSQKFGFQIDRILESGFVFLDKENFSTNAMLDELHIPNRSTVPTMPIFPWQFGRVTFKRQSYMTPSFLADTSLQNRVKAIWGLYGRMLAAPAPTGDTLQTLLNSVKAATDKIKARGGQVVFLRPPSSEPVLSAETRGFPREKYWDRILSFTQCPGIHFKDYPAIDHFVCPESSHLSSRDAVSFTRELISILEKEQKWSFTKKTAAL